MKHHNSNYLQLSRNLFSDKYENLSVSAKWLYVVLNELEQRYTGDGKRSFFRANEELAKDSGMSERTVQRAKNELKTSGLVKISKAHFIDKEGKRSRLAVTVYEIPRSEKKLYDALGMKECRY